MSRKPELGFWQIWNMCFGFLGIQFGFALQNANVSRIFETLGSNVEQIPILWIAAPLTGLLVQPIIGHYSDRTWTRLGRRRPYFLAGALLSAGALVGMPHASALWMAAVTLWIMDASFNVSMEPFRAFVADQLPERQRPAGYAMQTFFIGIGAVIASALPWLLTQIGFDNTAAPGRLPETVRYAFYVGAVVLLLSMVWTVGSTQEYPPQQLDAFADESTTPSTTDGEPVVAPARLRRSAWVWSLSGVGSAMGVWLLRLKPEVYLLAGGLLAFGLLSAALAAYSGGQRASKTPAWAQIMRDLHGMPAAMRRLAWVQFFSWFALFAMWIYTTPAVTAAQFHATNPQSAAFNAGANWVGILFAVYNAVAALAAIALAPMARRLGLRMAHLLNLWLGAAGFLSISMISNPHWLVVPMIGIGIAWASILSLPYALLSDHLPARKMGVYMGIFNFFIVIPQLLAASILGLLVRYLFDGHAMGALLLGALSLFAAGLAVLRVREPSAARSSMARAT